MASRASETDASAAVEPNQDDQLPNNSHASTADEESPLIGSAQDAPQRALTSIAGVITVLLLGAKKMHFIFDVAHSNPSRRVHIQCRFYNHYGGRGLYFIRVQSLARCQLAVDFLYSRTLCCPAYGAFAFLPTLSHLETYTIQLVWQTQRYLRPQTSSPGILLSTCIRLCYLVSLGLHNLIRLVSPDRECSGIGPSMSVVILGRIISGMGGAGIVSMSAIIITGTASITVISP